MKKPKRKRSPIPVRLSKPLSTKAKPLIISAPTRPRKEAAESKKPVSHRRRLAENLKQLRSKAGLSQAAMAKKAKIGVATYQRIEQCQATANPGLDVLEKLAGALGVGFERLWA